MRLEKIKLAGFKSFVDPTALELQGDFIGIVGPNGCGKSNIVDAIRWVLGESSAKQLRGSSLTDVIFNGSKNRKPIGQAAIELVFDNSDATMGGEYASYSQISVRREIDREGQSVYSLNSTRCRRRDIIDAFLGTGIGSYNYAIIEQGTISSIVEAKPEELREYVEEAAGISKYKERKKETESRMERTQENLLRVKDLLHELDGQLARLQRQAKAAERYKVLKEEERLTKCRAFILRYLDMEKQVQALEALLSQEGTALEAHQAELQGIETEVEKRRTVHAQWQEEFQHLQQEFYGVGNEITRLEQTLEQQKNHLQHIRMEIDRATVLLDELARKNESEQQQKSDWEKKKDAAIPQLAQEKQELDEAEKLWAVLEQNLKSWQAEWDEIQKKSAQDLQVKHLQESHIHHCEQQMGDYERRLQKMAEEKQSIQTEPLQKEIEGFVQSVDQLKNSLHQENETLTKVDQDIENQKQSNQQVTGELSGLRQTLQQMRERLVSLQVLQQAAFGENDQSMSAWLAQNHLDHHPRLAQSMRVAEGWEKAVETVLGPYLEAICVDELSTMIKEAAHLSTGKVILLEKTQAPSPVDPTNLILLSSKVEGALGTNFLQGVYVAETLEEALQKCLELKENESIVTKDGLWMGRHWVRVSKEVSSEEGILVREKELRLLEPEIAAQEALIAKRENELQLGNEQLQKLDESKAAIFSLSKQHQTQYHDLMMRKQLAVTQLAHLQERQKQLDQEHSTLSQQKSRVSGEVSDARKILETAILQCKQTEEAMGVLRKKHEELDRQLYQAKDGTRRHKEIVHQLEMQVQLAETQLATLQQSLEHLSQQTLVVTQQKELFGQELERESSKIDPIQKELSNALQKRLDLEKVLAEAKQRLDEVAVFHQTVEAKRREISAQIQALRESMEAKRIQTQELKVRQHGLKEQSAELQLSWDTVAQEMPATLTEKECLESVEKLAAQIHRLGLINLAAIQEYEELNQRKIYLDKQNADLDEALKMLQEAIQKIDQETKARFKETFDQLNQHFQALFPKIFKGGSAYLELSGQDVLSSGVVLMAQPPGKQLRNIHLLSGGEKALTAIALVFSLFQLNPAPFCILDEVDAPLDDVNVFRFCELLKEMSQTVQLIVVSHNKNTIEAAKCLLGVTMHEPGVSRIVAVNIDQALAMAEG